MANQGFDPKDLVGIINQKTEEVKQSLQKIRDKGDEISIGDSFELMYATQMLTATVESFTSVVTASHQAQMSLARGIKGQ